MDNMFNLAENTIVTFFSSGGDGDISAYANYIHPKIMEQPQKYLVHQNRAVAVHSVGYIGDDEDRHNDGIRMYIEVTACGGDLSDLDNDVKVLASLIVNRLRNESPKVEGKGMGEVFDDLYVDNADIFPLRPEGGKLIVQAGINAEVYYKGETTE